MENVTTISRPYATACFEFAKEQDNAENALNYWGAFLNFASQAINTEIGQNLCANYADYQEEVEKFILYVLPEEFHSKPVLNFLTVLKENSRFQYLPGIAEFYQKLREKYDLPTPVTVVSATQLTQDEAYKIVHSVANKVGRTVTCTFEIDPSILSGIIIKTEDFVVDASGRKTLENLSTQLTK